MPSPDDWISLVGQGGFVFFAVAMFAAILYAARRLWDDMAKPGFESFRSFLTSLEKQVERMADSSESTNASLKATNENLKQLAESHSSLHTGIESVKEMIERLKREALEHPRA